ncbi:MAG: hypothetical protein MMC23_005009 [Stictis urceolatum]|nr:hypothetical protein [Stictis urceolata]
MASSPPAGTESSRHFDPDGTNSPFNLNCLLRSLDFLDENNDLQAAIGNAFDLPFDDKWTYHANTAVTLPQVQSAINAGGVNNLHAWYVSPSTQKPLSPPPAADIEAYTELFNAKYPAANKLKALTSNAKKGSLRAEVGAYILSKRVLLDSLVVPKKKPPPINPYLDFWAWSCRAIKWAGPTADSVQVRRSHHILPIFMHHFGCVVPSYEALEVLRKVADGRPIVDMGSGNGYWTFMLRRMGLEVVAVDNGQSAYRTRWIGDTVVKDGVEWLRARKGAVEDVLLLVYPVTEGGVTGKLLAAYKGDTVCVAGTQNANGYTGFKDVQFEEYMKREYEAFEKVVQIPLPSFAGKDEAFFVFRKKGEEVAKNA